MSHGGINMAYFAHLDGEKLKGWYCDDVHDTIPTPNVEVTEEVWQQALNDGANAYVDSKFIKKDFTTNDEKIANKRLERDILLRDSDWTQFGDSPLSDSKKTEWATYRQSLRDLPAQSGFPNVDMPTKPGS